MRNFRIMNKPAYMTDKKNRMKASERRSSAHFHEGFLRWSKFTKRLNAILNLLSVYKHYRFLFGTHKFRCSERKNYNLQYQTLVALRLSTSFDIMEKICYFFVLYRRCVMCACHLIYLTQFFTKSCSTYCFMPVLYSAPWWGDESSFFIHCLSDTFGTYSFLVIVREAFRHFYMFWVPLWIF